jgi:hypothetical protein
MCSNSPIEPWSTRPPLCGSRNGFRLENSEYINGNGLRSSGISAGRIIELNVHSDGKYYRNRQKKKQLAVGISAGHYHESWIPINIFGRSRISLR